MDIYHTCQHCGKVFPHNSHIKLTVVQKFCSKECRHNSGNVVVHCLNCGKEMVKRRSAKRNKFCSCTCANRYNQPHDPSKRKMFTCKWCGKEFEGWVYRNPTICSNQCRSEYGAHQPKISVRKPENFVERVCQKCGKTFKMHKCFLTRGKNQGAYCSNTCRYAAVSEGMRGEGNRNYRGGVVPFRGQNWGSQARNARKRDGYNCQICGRNSKSEHFPLDVHHMIPFRVFSDNFELANHLNNLISACRICHKKLEYGKVKPPKQFMANLEKDSRFSAYLSFASYNRTASPRMLNIPLPLRLE